MPPPVRETLPSSMPLPGQMPAGGHTDNHGAATGGMVPMQIDPVCRMPVDPAKARAEGLVTELKGVTWFFDSAECKREFDADPSVYLPVVR